MIDNKGRLFGKVNIVDLCIVLILIVAVCATVFKFGFSGFGGINNKIGTPPIRVEYVMKISNIRDFTADSIKKGDKLFDDNKAYLGVITDVYVDNALEYIAMADGTIRKEKNPYKYDAYVTVECNANLKKGSYYAIQSDLKKSAPIQENMFLKVSSSRFTSTAQIQEVKQK